MSGAPAATTVTTATTHLLYLHGFRSSPRSAKAQLTADWIGRHRPDIAWWCPQLPPSPAESMRLLEAGTRHWPADRSAVVGSSLGGFYATAFAERTGCRAVLLNPAVEPARDLQKYIGEITAWHGTERFGFEPRFIDELRALRSAAITRPERYLALIAKGDEVLDWTEMAARYRDCPQVLIDGGDHALSDYASRLQAVLGALGIEAPTTV